jgi:hypothetical protein
VPQEPVLKIRHLEIHAVYKVWSNGHSRYDLYEPATNLDAVPEVKLGVRRRAWASC